MFRNQCRAVYQRNVKKDKSLLQVLEHFSLLYSNCLFRLPIENKNESECLVTELHKNPVLNRSFFSRFLKDM